MINDLLKEIAVDKLPTLEEEIPKAATNPGAIMPSQIDDPWKHRSEGMRCRTCMFFVEKEKDPLRMITEDVANINPEVKKNGALGRCHHHSPSDKGWKPVFETDWCGDHRLDENKIC